jgi:replicative DNA helicase
VEQVPVYRPRARRDSPRGTWIDDRPALTLDDADQLARAAGTGFTDFASGLRALARELDVPVVATVRLPLESDDPSGADFSPRVLEIPGGEETVRLCDVVLLLHDEGYYLPAEEAHERGLENELQIVAAKNAHGLVDDVRVRWLRRKLSVG